MSRFYDRLFIIISFILTCLALLFFLIFNLGVGSIYSKIELYYLAIELRFFVLIFFLFIKGFIFYFFRVFSRDNEFNFTLNFFLFEFLFLGLMSIYLLIFPPNVSKDRIPIENYHEYKMRENDSLRSDSNNVEWEYRKQRIQRFE